MKSWNLSSKTDGPVHSFSQQITHFALFSRESKKKLHNSSTEEREHWLSKYQCILGIRWLWKAEKNVEHCAEIGLCFQDCVMSDKYA